MKTYCKPATVNIEDWKFNELAVVECFRNKRSRKDFQRLLCKTGKITKREIVEDQLNKDFKRTLEAESEVAKMLTQRIINRDLQLKPIRQFQRIDGLTQKLRDICQESPEQQVFEYIGVYALKPLFRAKILPIQYGSIPNKGGVAGNALNMWIKSVTKPGDLEQIQWGAKVPEEFQNEVLKDYMKTMASGGVA